jgi:hypothetical protein
MAGRMARGSTNFAQDWLKVNGDNNANNAMAMDARGYWWIEGTWTGGYDIKGPIRTNLRKAEHDKVGSRLRR